MTSTTTLEAERADRISRLAGLERVATARAGGGTATSQPTTMPPTMQNPGYFDSSMGLKERSTVGSASATGSVGARTTWASSSDAPDVDKMSEDPDDGTSSVGNISEGDASLVGFGEGASTISGPISHSGLNRTASGGGRPNSLGSPTGRSNPIAPFSHMSNDSTRLHSTMSPTGSITPEPAQDARMVDGMTYDPDVVDTTVRTPRLATPADPDVPGNPASEQRLG
ncbi:uncharacterized protein KD926_004849 [Aspergillus affinis]|uniref:uncharacterized protein n=1 Tax=Aspergillus affinis TaxID=1070780 RepID=UPI0022FDFEC0|nr:uncharacterized protein KD926_004849 [Aspergillus affinis]KAI9034982.1 hypothetical protein KD926_004849 [Aspergillus affinis]